MEHIFSVFKENYCYNEHFYYLSQIVSSKSQSNSKFGISTRVMEKYVRQFPSIYFGLSLASVIQQIVIFNSERVLLRVFSSVQIIKSTK